MVSVSRHCSWALSQLHDPSALLMPLAPHAEGTLGCWAAGDRLWASLLSDLSSGHDPSQGLRLVLRKITRHGYKSRQRNGTKEMTMQAEALPGAEGWVTY